MFNRFINPFFRITELFDSSIRRDIKLLRQFGLDLIQRRKTSNVAKHDLLQLFMDYEDENGKLSDETLCDQVLNFIIAGRDTTYSRFKIGLKHYPGPFSVYLKTHLH